MQQKQQQKIIEILHSTCKSKQANTKADISAKLKHTNLWNYRLNIILRTLIAIFGTYALAIACANFSAQIMVIFGIERLDAYQASIMLAFLLQVITIMWIFHSTNLYKIGLVITCSSLILAIAVYLLATFAGLAI